MMVSAAEATSLGRQARNIGDLAAARGHYAEAATIYREQNNLPACAHSLRHIADMYLQERNFGEARPLYEEALAIYRGSLDTKLLDLANTVRPYALLQEETGNAEEARQFWHEARNLYASLRLEAGVAECQKHIDGLAGA